MLVSTLIFYQYFVSLYRRYCCGAKCEGRGVRLEAEGYVIRELEGSCSTERGQLCFTPQLYIQRYTTVKRVLEDKRAQGVPIRKVVDMGCGEMSMFLYYLKKTEGVEEVICVDADMEVLERHSCRVSPLNCDYLDQRATPLHVSVLHGSVAEPHVSLENANVVIAIELIEHLYPPDLEELPYVIFGLVQPETVVITTPNADFNVLFPNFTGFRHPDHKFEWSKDQFIDWCKNLERRYPIYKVAIQGVGRGPRGFSHLGSCSQIAVFSRTTKTIPSDTSHLFNKDSYKLIVDVDYPVCDKANEPSLEDQVRYESENFIRYAANRDEFSTHDRIEIPLQRIYSAVSHKCASIKFLRDVLEKRGWSIEECEGGLGESLVLPYYGIVETSSSAEEEDVEGEGRREGEEVVEGKGGGWEWEEEGEEVWEVEGEGARAWCKVSRDSGLATAEMETDLTPEQVDDITTESEEEVEVEVEDEEVVHPLLPPPPPQHMENADVANNNRDWQGNNMEPQEGEALEFEGVIAERGELEGVEVEAPRREEEPLRPGQSINGTLGQEGINGVSGVQKEEEEEEALSRVRDGIKLQALEKKETKSAEEEGSSSEFPDWLLSILRPDDDLKVNPIIMSQARQPSLIVTQD